MEDVRDVCPIYESLIEAGEAIGLPRNPDFNGATQEGIGYYQTIMKGGRRWSTARAYLDSARFRPEAIKAFIEGLVEGSDLESQLRDLSPKVPIVQLHQPEG